MKAWMRERAGLNRAAAASVEAATERESSAPTKDWRAAEFLAMPGSYEAEVLAIQQSGNQTLTEVAHNRLITGRLV